MASEMTRPARGERIDAQDPEVAQADACLGFLVSSNGSRVRLELLRLSGEPWLLECSRMAECLRDERMVTVPAPPGSVVEA